VEYAQSPQALVLDDRVRIYFSCRERDSVGKYLSHVAFVDFELDLGRIMGVSRQPVIELGQLGCFDEHGIFPFSVLKEESRILAYTTGWNRKVSVSADASIGLAVSHDQGLTFQRSGTGPLLSASLHEPFLVADAFVRIFDGVYHMWYIFGTKWLDISAAAPAERVYKIAHATSHDGIHWQRDGRQVISDSLNANECQALPTVLKADGRYHMFFCYRQALDFRSRSSNAYRIGYAYSRDLVEWIRADDIANLNVSEEGWDAEMMCYPHVFTLNGKIYLLYNGNKFGRFGFGLAELNSFPSLAEAVQ
jgi:hypothetical protein